MHTDHYSESTPYHIHHTGPEGEDQAWWGDEDEAIRSLEHYNYSGEWQGQGQYHLNENRTQILIIELANNDEILPVFKP